MTQDELKQVAEEASAELEEIQMSLLRRKLCLQQEGTAITYTGFLQQIEEEALAELLKKRVSLLQRVIDLQRKETENESK
jgi:hypothetical protein